MANIMDGRCTCPDKMVNPKNVKPCVVPGHPDGRNKPTPEPKKR